MAKYPKRTTVTVKIGRPARSAKADLRLVEEFTYKGRKYWRYRVKGASRQMLLKIRSKLMDKYPGHSVFINRTNVGDYITIRKNKQRK